MHGCKNVLKNITSGYGNHKRNTISTLLETTDYHFYFLEGAESKFIFFFALFYIFVAQFVKYESITELYYGAAL